MVYEENLNPSEAINLKLSILEERITILEDFKNQTLTSIEKLTKSVVELLQKKETYENLVAEIEKIQGRLDVVNELKNQLTETTRTFSEEIGELRTMILDREKSFSKIEIGFEKINEIVKDIEPQTIRKNFEKKEQKILELEARIEKLERFSKELIKQTEKVREVIEKVKSFENLVSVAERVKKYLRQAEETKNYADRIAGKVETMFEDMNNKVIDLDEKSAKLEDIDSLLKELVPTVDKLQIEVSNKADKEDVVSLKRSGVSRIVEEKIDKIEKDEAEIQKKFINLEESKKQIDDELKKLKDRISVLFPEDLKLREDLKMKIKLLAGEIEEIEKAYNRGEIDEASYKERIEKRKKEREELLEKLKEIKMPTISEIRNLEKEVRSLKEELSKKNLINLEKEIKEMNKNKKLLETYAEIIKVMKPSSLHELLTEKEKTKVELSLLEEQYKSGIISKENFEELYEKKKSFLFELDSLIKDKERQERIINELKNLHIVLSKLSDIVPNIRKNSNLITNLKKEIDSLKEERTTREEERISELTEKISSLNLGELRKDVSEINNKLSTLSESLNYESKFFQLTSILPYINEKSVASFYVARIKSLILKLKSIGRFDEEKENYLNKLFRALASYYKNNRELSEFYLNLI